MNNDNTTPNQHRKIMNNDNTTPKPKDDQTTTVEGLDDATCSLNAFVCGRWQDNLPTDDVSLMVADPVYGSTDIGELVEMAVERKIPSAIFMWPDDVWGLPHKPEQILHWIKPESTKNTAKRYSRFVEVIACYNLKFVEPLHWSNRTGIFTDRLMRNDDHPWKKPESMIERLIRNHWPKRGIVYDPCAGSRTVETVCKRLGIGSFSVDVFDFANAERTRGANNNQPTFLN